MVAPVIDDDLCTPGNVALVRLAILYVVALGVAARRKRAR